MYLYLGSIFYLTCLSFCRISFLYAFLIAYEYEILYILQNLYLSNLP
nr:MAG TPA: hypothetical protein [Caudoviricetes sp.]